MIVPIPALEDNYIWMMVNTQAHTALIVDPGEAAPVFDYLKQHHLELAGILLTHHHWDHTNGVPELLRHYEVPVIASMQNQSPHVTRRVSDHEQFSVHAEFPMLTALAIPGHTLDHTAYYVGDALFSGDTLFGGGCGRIFEGTPEQMYASLQKLSALPERTQIYCGHEYTLANLGFAIIVEPNNPLIAQRIATSSALNEQNTPTVPSLLREEKNTNPFLRCDILEVQQSVSAHMGRELNEVVEVFAALREWKNRF